MQKLILLGPPSPRVAVTHYCDQRFHMGAGDPMAGPQSRTTSMGAPTGPAPQPLLLLETCKPFGHRGSCPQSQHSRPEAGGLLPVRGQLGLYSDFSHHWTTKWEPVSQNQSKPIQYNEQSQGEQQVAVTQCFRRGRKTRGSRPATVTH